jgi:50S ribosomal subunit-associated GTPase HflX
MKGLDGVIFVADSQNERMEENLESLRNLEKNLEAQGYDIREIPLVFQYNKRDLPNSASLAELRTQESSVFLLQRTDGIVSATT